MDHAHSHRKTRTPKTALICGIGGQDGAYLAAHLLEQGYAVVGTSRDAQANRFESLARLGIRDRVTVESMTLVDFRSTMQAIARHEPDEIYNLAGQTSVGLSFDQPVETFESIIIGTVNLLETIRMLGKPIRLYNAGSSEMFGNTGDRAAGETTVLRPRSPYGIAKATSFWQIAQYRDQARRSLRATRLGLGTGIRGGHARNAATAHPRGFRDRDRADEHPRGLRGGGVSRRRPRLAELRAAGSKTGAAE